MCSCQRHRSTSAPCTCSCAHTHDEASLGQREQVERAEYDVRIDRADGLPVFRGRVGPDDHMRLVQSIDGPMRVELTASGGAAFLYDSDQGKTRSFDELLDQASLGAPALRAVLPLDTITPLPQDDTGDDQHVVWMNQALFERFQTWLSAEVGARVVRMPEDVAGEPPNYLVSPKEFGKYRPMATKES